MRIAIVFGMLLTLAACNSVKNAPLPAKTDEKALADVGKQLNDEDKRLLAGYMVRRSMAEAFGNELKDDVKTVGDAIAAQKEWADKRTKAEAAAAELKADVELKRKAVAEQISQAVTIAFVSAEFEPSNYQTGRYEDYELFDFAVKNTSPKPIKAVKGMAVFTDTFGDEFVSVPMRFEEVIAPGEQKTIQLSKEINKFMDSDKRIMALDGSKKFRFVAEQIVFGDDSTIKAPETKE